MASIEQNLSYAFASSIENKGGKCELKLCSSLSEQNPTYFTGEILAPVTTAKCLQQLSILVASRFFTPPAMLARILRESDPVVTVSKKMLRFEGFSACCSTYCRLDILPEAIKAEKMVPGTTNIDFNAQMRGLLAKFRNQDQMAISVSKNEVEIQNSHQKVLEKKVKLPIRWIKGFAEVQSIQSNMSKAFRLSKNDAIRFFRQLPKGSTRHPVWAIKAGTGIRLSHREVKDSLRIKGIERLAVLAGLTTLAKELVVYKNPQNTMSAWVLSFGQLRFTLVLSEEKWRGFSGEGQLLQNLATSEKDHIFHIVKSALNWQDAIDVATLSKDNQINENKLNATLNMLASTGLVGFDVTTGQYFHRVLPFNEDNIAKLNPRLLAAQKLVENNKVTLLKNTNNHIKAQVNSSDVSHRVEIAMHDDNQTYKCTCPWFVKHQSSRGACKHILSVQIFLENQ